MIKCDGPLGANENYSEEAKYIARSKEDPNVCVYYSCEQHINSYEKTGDFIVERI